MKMPTAPTKYDQAWSVVKKQRYLKADLTALLAGRPNPTEPFERTNEEILRETVKLTFDFAIKYEQSRQRAIKKGTKETAAKKR